MDRRKLRIQRTTLQPAHSGNFGKAIARIAPTKVGKNTEHEL